MTTVYVVTAGSGDTYRIERVYLDSDQAYGFAQNYNGTEPLIDGIDNSSIRHSDGNG